MTHATKAKPEYCPACGAEAELEAFDDRQNMCAVFIVRCKCPGIYREERIFGDTYAKDPHGAWMDSRIALIKSDFEQQFGEDILEDLEVWRNFYNA